MHVHRGKAFSAFLTDIDRLMETDVLPGLRKIFSQSLRQNTTSLGPLREYNTSDRKAGSSYKKHR